MHSVYDAGGTGRCQAGKGEPSLVGAGARSEKWKINEIGR